MKNVKFSLTIALALILMLTCLACNLKFANAENPPSYHRNVSSVVHTDGDVQNAWRIQGEADGSYATMISYYIPAGFPPAWTPPSDVAIVIGEMNDLAIGEIWIRCCKPSAVYPDFGMMVYTSNDATNGPWNLVGTFWVTGASLNWYEIETVTEPGYTPSDWPEGYAPEPYRYIALAIMSTSPDINGYVYIDAVAAEPYTPPPPPPPSSFPVTINIRDDSGNLLAGEIYINGYLAGYTSVTVNLLGYYQTGTVYELYVTADDSNYVFQYYTASDGSSTTNNPTPLYVIQPGTITAVFAPSAPPPPPPPPPTTYSLTVYAYNQYGQPGAVPLYIDGQYVGTTGYSYTVTSGNHQIYVESPLYSGAYHVFYCYYYDSNYNYDNPMTLSVTSDKTVTAYYYSYY